MATSLQVVSGGIRTGGDILPRQGDGAGNLGLANNRWGNLWAATVNGGDFAFSNGWRMTEDGDAILLVRPDGSVAHRWT